MHAIGSTTGQQSRLWSILAETDLRGPDSWFLFPRGLKSSECWGICWHPWFFFFFPSPTGTLDWKDHILSMASAMAVFQKFKVVWIDVASQNLKIRLTDTYTHFCMCNQNIWLIWLRLHTLTGSGLDSPLRTSPLRISTYNLHFHWSNGVHGSGLRLH